MIVIIFLLFLYFLCSRFSNCHKQTNNDSMAGYPREKHAHSKWCYSAREHTITHNSLCTHCL